MSIFVDGASGRARTCGLQLRKLSLYPAELRMRAHILLKRMDIFHFRARRSDLALPDPTELRAREELEVLSITYTFFEPHLSTVLLFDSNSLYKTAIAQNGLDLDPFLQAELKALDAICFENQRTKFS